MNFAVGQRATCRLQIFSLPSANKKFADGKCAAGHRQNSLRINGKIKFSNRQIPYITSCRSAVKHLFQAGSFKTIPKLRQAPPKKTNYREYQRKKARACTRRKKHTRVPPADTPCSERQRNSAACKTPRRTPSAGREGGGWGGRETTPLKKRCLSLPKNKLQRIPKKKARTCTRRKKTHARATADAPCRDLQRKQTPLHYIFLPIIILILWKQ